MEITTENTIDLENATPLSRYEKLALLIANKTDATGINIQTSDILWAITKKSVPLYHLSDALFYPKIVFKTQEQVPLVTPTIIRKRWISPVLRALRGDRTLAEMTEPLNIYNVSTYHHWESGRRDIPLSIFLKIIDTFSDRLLAFIESLPLQISLAEAGFDLKSSGIYAQFFNEPWTPTLLLSFRLPQLLNKGSTAEQTAFLRKKLLLSEEQVETSVNTLLRLNLIKFSKNIFITNSYQLYAIPGIPSAKIDEMQTYWFERSLEQLKQTGFHKVEQHALSNASKEKIISWIIELREKIRICVNEDQTPPETLIHINWNVTELI